MVGFNRQVRTAVHRPTRTPRSVPWSGVGSLPRQRRPPRSGQLVPQRGAGRLPVRRRGWAFHRHSERPGRARPGRSARHGNGRGTSTPPCASPTDPWRRSPTSPTAARVSRRRPWTSCGDGRNGRLDNFQRVTVWSSKGKNGRRALAGQDKGQRAQLERFVDAVRTGSAMPIPLELPGGDHARNARGGKQPGDPRAGDAGEPRPPAAGTCGGSEGCRATEVVHRTAWTWVAAARGPIARSAPARAPPLPAGVVRRSATFVVAAAGLGPRRRHARRRVRADPRRRHMSWRDLDGAGNAAGPTAPTRTGSMTR